MSRRPPRPQPRFQWVEPSYEGGFDLMHGARKLIEVRQHRPTGWYWKGLGRDTQHRLGVTLAQAKREAEAHAYDVFDVADRAGGLS